MLAFGWCKPSFLYTYKLVTFGATAYMVGYIWIFVTDNNRISTTTLGTTAVPSITLVPSVAANTKSDDNSNVGAAVGIVVGILLVLALIAIVVVVIYFVKRWYDKNRIAHHKFTDDDDAELVKSSETFDNPTYENPVYDMDWHLCIAIAS